jgi:hypothetical protein
MRLARNLTLTTIAVNAVLGTIGAVILTGFVGGLLLEKAYEHLSKRKGSAS